MRKRFYSVTARPLFLSEVKGEASTTDLWFLAFPRMLGLMVNGRESLTLSYYLKGLWVSIHMSARKHTNTLLSGFLLCLTLRRQPLTVSQARVGPCAPYILNTFVFILRMKYFRCWCMRESELQWWWCVVHEATWICRHVRPAVKPTDAFPTEQLPCFKYSRIQHEDVRRPPFPRTPQAMFT